MRVLVVEGDRVAAGVSGFTTAKLTAGHGLVYSHPESAFDAETARTYAEAQTAAIFADSNEDLRELEAEAAAAERARLGVELVAEADLPFARPHDARAQPAGCVRRGDVTR